MSSLLQDLGYALRLMRKRWGMTSVATLVMALGIGLTASMYAIIDGVVLSGPDYPDVRSIAYISTTIPQSQFNQSVRLHDYLDWKSQQTVFQEMAAYYGTSVNLSGDQSRAESYRGSRVTASTFALLRAQPLLGRTFTPDEDHRSDLDIVLLSHDVWVDRYDRNPGIVGSQIRVNARPTTVIGVMPPGFRFPEDHDVWLPLGVDPGALERREGPGLGVIGRMRPEVTVPAVRSQLVTIARRLEAQYPETNRDIVPVVETWVDAQFVDDETRGILYTMFVAVLGVLLIACANVANLLFATTVARAKEMAIRTALGAARVRVLRQILSETLVLAAGGALLGLVLARFGLGIFTRVVAGLAPPPWMVFELSPAVLLFAVGVTGAAALVSGILPAVLATRVDVGSVLQDQSRGSSGRSVGRWSTVLVAIEVALSCALLVAAGLTIRSTIEVRSADYGVNRDGVLTARVQLPEVTYPDSVARLGFSEALEAELAALPGVTQVALSSSLPVLGTALRFYGVRDRDYGDDSEYAFAGYTHVGTGFFDLVGAPLVAGRGFRPSDAFGTERVAIVDQRFAQRNWPGQDPLGRQVRLGRSDSDAPWLTVVGVVRTLEMLEPLNFAANPPENMYVPLSQQPASGLYLLLRSSGDPTSLATPVLDLIQRLDPDIPVTQLDTFDERVRRASLDSVILGGMFTTFGVIALVLASIGLYAVMAFSVTRRTAEVGIRLALGATGTGIVRLIVGQGARPVGFGLAVGLVLAVFLGRALSTVLYNVKAVDALTYAGVPILLAAVSLVALLIPASGAAGIPPVTALRDE